MKKQDKSITALLAVFPTPESLTRFAAESDNARAVQSFITFAKKNSLIAKNDFQSLSSLIATHVRAAEDSTLPTELDFGELLEKRGEWIRCNLSIRSLTERINSLIGHHGIKLPRVSDSMLARLKDKPANTNQKQNTLRSLAFWLGHERTDLGPIWNFETLMKLCADDKAASYSHLSNGVRIGFTLHSRGDVIDHSIMNELKAFIKDYFDQESGLRRGLWGKVRSHDFTTLFVDIPKVVNSEDPTSYRSCIKIAFSMAHQISIRWSLSRHYSHNRFLSIGIVAGEYMTLDNYLIPLLKAKLPEDPVIRVSDFVRRCALISEIKVEFCRTPKEMVLFNEATFLMWWISGFWGSLYFDFVPDLLKDPLLRNGSASKILLSQSFWFPEEAGFKTPDDTPNAVTKFLRFPENLLLGLEIAKTLYHRREFQPALEILRTILSTDPANPSARCMRMVLFRELAILAPTFFIVEHFLKQSEHEAIYIQENCEGKTEDFFCEYGNLFLARAILLVRHMRAGKISSPEIQGISQAKQMVFDALDKADYFFNEALTLSQLTIRSWYLLHVARIVKAVLKHDDDVFTNPAKTLNSRPEIVAEPSSDFRWLAGVIENGASENGMHLESESDFLMRLMIRRFDRFNDSISLSAALANHCFGHAASMWDFIPCRTARVAKRVLKMLNEAIAIAENLAKDEICIYSYTRIHPEMMPAEVFIRHMKRAIQMVTSLAGADILNKNDDEILKVKGNMSSLLMTLNFE